MVTVHSGKIPLACLHCSPDLFPPGVAAAELRTPADPSMLYAEETRDLGLAARKRAEEFTAGRLCARLALATLGIEQFPLRVSQDRRPLWPASIVGSITHTTGMCGAVVAERRLFRSIGVDMEIVGSVTREIWPYICTPEEIAWLTSLPERQQMKWAALGVQRQGVILQVSIRRNRAVDGISRYWTGHGIHRMDQWTLCAAIEKRCPRHGPWRPAPEWSLPVPGQLCRHGRGSRSRLTADPTTPAWRSRT